MFSDPVSNLAKLGLVHGMRVADLGAGTGFYSLEAARRVGKDGRVYAIEVQKDLLERLRSTGAAQGVRNIEVIWGNIEKIGGTKLAQSLVDRVIISNVLFQVTSHDNLALEAKRILKPGGKVLVVDWSGVTPLSPKKLVTEMQARTIFEKSGFTFESSFDAGDHHYGLIFLRSS